MARKPSAVLSPAEKRVAVRALRDALKSEKSALTLMRKDVSAAKKVLKQTESAFLKQGKNVVKAVAAVAKATGK
jgi:isocitrate dehydrogenase